ncbi:MAG: type II toxin-antitoxin system RelE family toxin [Fusobacteriaceae bacterium]
MISYKVKYSKDSLKFMKDNRKVGLRFFQAIFEIVENEIVIFVLDIDSRGDIYKNL